MIAPFVPPTNTSQDILVSEDADHMKAPASRSAARPDRAGSPVTARPDALEERIHAEKVRTVWETAPTSTIGSLPAGLFLIAALWDQVPHAHAVLWGAFLVEEVIRVFLMYRAYRRAAPAPGPASEEWGRRYLYLGILTSGVMWGAAGVVFYTPGSLIGQMYLVFVLVGITGASVPFLAVWTPAFMLLVLTVTTPFIAYVSIFGSGGERALVIPMAVFVGVVLLFGRNLNRMLVESIHRRFEIEALAGALREQKEIAELANRTKTQFLAAASHDLRQPLQALGLFVASLRLRSRDAETSAVIGRIERAMGALEGVLEALLDISKLDAGVVTPRFERFPASRVLDAVREQFTAAAEAHQLRLTVMPTAMWCASDPNMLERVLSNLVSNAIRYTPAGGVLVGCRRTGADGLRFEVWDTGLGIPEDQQREIFREFIQLHNPERSRDKGLGLGLAIVERLCLLLGHRVTLRSTRGKGSVFCVEVPRVPAEQSAAPMHDEQGATGALAGRHVLVIDDDREVLEALSELLTANGASVFAAPSATAARDVVRALGRSPDVMVSDYRLAAGEDGIRGLQALRWEFGEHIPAAILTGDIAPSVLQAVADAGLPLLHKPIRPAQLVASLDALLDGGTGASETSQAAH
jgi:signal transduction histidine kinase/CheY-like chemotaxis protein